jgi:hypothetical protein
VNKEELGGENKGCHLPWRREKSLPSISRAKEVSPNPNSLLSFYCLFVAFSSSPTLFHSFFSLILLQVVHLRLEENGLLVVYHSIFGSHGLGG